MYLFQDHAKGVQLLISLREMKESFHSNGELDGFLGLLELVHHAHSSFLIKHINVIIIHHDT
jgi:hypothetical protein